MGLDRVGAKNIVPSANQTISADDFILQHHGRPSLLLALTGSGDTHISAEGLSIADGCQDGQLLDLILVDVGNNNEIILRYDANTHLKGPWHADTVGEYIRLVWDKNNSYWRELSRDKAVDCLAAGAHAVALGSGHICGGDYSFASGGDNYCQGEGSFAAGVGNYVIGDYSTVLGKDAYAALYGEQSFSAGMFEGAGDAQSSRFLLRAETTDATQTEAFLDGVDDRLLIGSNYALACTVTVLGKEYDGSDVFMGVYHVLISNLGGTTALVGAVDIAYENNAGSWGAGGGLPVEITADDASNALIIKVEGLAGHNIRWVILVNAITVYHGAAAPPP